MVSAVLAGCGGGGGSSASKTLVSIAVTPTNPTIAVGTTQQFTATGIFSDNSTQDLTPSVMWSSSSGSVAAAGNSPGSAGKVTALAVGTSTISASSGGISGSTTLTVSSAALVSIAVSPANPTIAVGTTQQFTATGVFSDNSTQDLTASVTWSSVVTSVAAISNASGSSGKAGSASPGTTAITATLGSVSGSTILTVSSASLVSIAVTPANPTIAIGFYEQFTATGTFSDKTTQDLTSLATWSSSAPSIASIAGTNGKATSLAPGTASITATLGSISGSTTVTVSSSSLASITVTPANADITAGAAQQFTATGTFSDKTTQNLTSVVVWTSSNPSAATVSNASSSMGTVTAVAAGTTTINASYVSISGSTNLTVTAAQQPMLEGITITPPVASITLGSAQQFTATGSYTDGTTQDLTSMVVWSSSVPSVATISNATGSKGMATSSAIGTTNIQCGYSVGPFSASATLTVSQLPANTYMVGVNPAGIAIDSSGDAWLSNLGGSSVTELLSSGTAWVLGNTFTSSSSSGGNDPGASPFGIAIDYAGDIWLTNYNAGTITMINLNEPANNATTCPVAPTNVSGRVIYHFTAGGTGPRGIAIESAINAVNPYTTYTYNLWAANFGTPAAPGNTVTKYTAQLIFCSASAAVPANAGVISSVNYPVGNNPYGVAIDSMGNIWVSNYGDNTVTELSPGGAVLGTIPVGLGPMGIAIDPSGNVWVANSGSNTVTMINPSTGATAKYTVGTGPHSIAIETSGNVWVTNFGSAVSPGNTITELSPGGTLINTFTVGKNPEGIAIDFSGNVWVTNYYDNTVTILQGKTSGSHFSPYGGPIWPQ